MAVKLNDKYLRSFIEDSEYKAIAETAAKAEQTLMSKSGAGNDFLGWVELPTNYDKEEFERIKKAA